MRKLYRFLISVYSLITAFMTLVLMGLLVNGTWANAIPVLFATLAYRRTSFFITLVALLLIFSVSLVVLVYALMTGRLRKTRIRSTEIGVVEIGVDALESIALNSARAAQVGIKTAKARVYSAQGSKINVELRVELFSDVEIPAQMNKIQDRIKKDIERYTGVPVAEVSIRVARVDLVGAKVER